MSENEKERRWLYFVVKIIVLIVVAGCLVGVNVVGRKHTSAYRTTVTSVSYGWPLRYGLVLFVLKYQTAPSSCIFAYELPDFLSDFPNLPINIIIAIILLIYLSHAINVFHRWKPIYQYSLRTLLALPVLLGIVMALIHYDVLSWRRAFLVPVYLAALASVVCLIYDVRSFVKKRTTPDTLA